MGSIPIARSMTFKYPHSRLIDPIHGGYPQPGDIVQAKHDPLSLGLLVASETPPCCFATILWMCSPTPLPSIEPQIGWFVGVLQQNQRPHVKWGFVRKEFFRGKSHRFEIEETATADIFSPKRKRFKCLRNQIKVIIKVPRSFNL